MSAKQRLQKQLMRRGRSMNAEGGIYYPVGCSVKCYTVSVGYHSGWIIMSEFRSLMLGRMIFSLFPRLGAPIFVFMIFILNVRSSAIAQFMLSIFAA